MLQNLSRQINQSLVPDVLELVKKASRESRRQNQKLYLVGGIVRDLLLGKTSLDLDLCVEGEALLLARALGDELGCRFISHPRFKTATIKLNNILVDIASARTETYTCPGALPQVTRASILDDLYRRDFTINAMALDLSESNFGDLIDPLGGQKDLVRKTIRVIHEKSFVDDPTRIFRAVRYEQRLGFKIEEKSLAWLARDENLVNHISGDRIRNEIELMLREEQPEKSLNRAGSLRLWQTINPEIRASCDLSNAFNKLRLSTLKTPYPLPVLFGILFFSLDQQSSEHLIERLNLPKVVAAVLRDTMRLKNIRPDIETAVHDRLAFFHLLKDFSSQAVLTFALSSPGDVLEDALYHFYKKLRFTRTSLKGRDLLKLGFVSGPYLGKVLQRLLDARVLGQVKNRKEEVEFIKAFLSEKKNTS